MIEYFRACGDDFADLAPLIRASCSDPATQCIHSTISDDLGAIRDEMLELAGKGELCYVVAREEDGIVGALGCEADVAIGRGWLRGPFVVGANRDRIAAEMLARLEARLPTGVTRLDTYLAVHNEWGNAFWRGRGFEEHSVAHVYEIGRSTFDGGDTPSVERYKPNHRDGVIPLHDLLFPGTFLDGRALIQSLDDTHVLHVVCLDGRVAGYAYAEIERHTAEGFVTFLGVSAESRRRGVATDLLRASLDWVFEHDGLDAASLTVEDQRAGARRLYEKIGFWERYAGVNLRRVVDA